MKLTCTLEFKEGRPVAKTVNVLKRPNKSEYSSSDMYYYFTDFEKFWKAENSRREFEIDRKIYKITTDSDFDFQPSLGIAIGNEVIPEHGIFTATIENNLVTKIELL